MVPLNSDRVSRAPPYSRICNLLTCTGLSPTTVTFSKAFQFLITDHRPGPRSLVTTSGVSFDFLSSGYLDISVHRVCLAYLCIQHAMANKSAGFPHSDICGSKLVDNSPQLIAAYHVLHHLLAPRHPSSALSCLFIRSDTCSTKTAQLFILYQLIESRSSSERTIPTIDLSTNLSTIEPQTARARGSIESQFLTKNANSVNKLL